MFVKFVDLLLIEYNLLCSFLKSYHLEMQEHIICQPQKMSWVLYLLKVQLVRLSSQLFHFAFPFSVDLVDAVKFDSEQD